MICECDVHMEMVERAHVRGRTNHLVVGLFAV